MPSLLIASAVIPAVCEEAIRSSYLYYLSDRGKRRLAVLAIGAVFVLGEVVYDTSLLPSAMVELGASKAVPLFVLALLTGIFLHIGLTLWTAKRLSIGDKAWRVFAIALIAHAGFNLTAITMMRSAL
jgi:hypothetical protein